MDSDYDEDEYTYSGIGSIHQHQTNASAAADDDDDENNISSSDDDDDNNGIGFVPGGKKSKKNEEHIYGVFGRTSSDEDDYGGSGSGSGGGGGGGGGGRKKRRGATDAGYNGGIQFKRQKRNNDGTKLTVEKGLDSVFVSSKKNSQDENDINATSADDSKKEGDNDPLVQNPYSKDDADGADDGNTQIAAKEISESTPDEEEEKKKQEKEDEEEAERQKKEMEDTSAKFFAMLERGKTSKRNQRKPKSSSSTASMIRARRTQPFYRSQVEDKTTTTATATATATASKTNSNNNNNDEEDYDDETPQVGIGLGFHSQKNNNHNDQTEKEQTKTHDDNTPPSLSSFFTKNNNHFEKFLGSSNQSSNHNSRNSIYSATSTTTGTTTTTPIQRDPNLGKWEKHTKGIGMKLLAKMGYKGTGGLGAKRLRSIKTKSEKENHDTISSTTDANKSNDGGSGGEMGEVGERKGISRPVEVVVRPDKLGLGFGSFKEATKLKTNIRIEAEVRGVDWKKKEEEERKKKEEKEYQEQKELNGYDLRSVIPTTESLLSSGNWRKDNNSGRKRKRKEAVKRKIISYQDLITSDGNAAKNVILDMRGPEVTNINPSSFTDSRKGDNSKYEDVKLGEEVLHNITFLVNTYENKLHSTSHFVRSSKNKAKSIQSDVDSLVQRRKEIQTRKAKLEKVLEIIEKIECVKVDSKLQLIRFESLMQSLNNNFTSDEKKSLQYYSILVPSLLSPIIEQRLRSWKPSLDKISQSKDYTNESLNLCSTCCPDIDTVSLETLQKLIIKKHILPPVWKALQSSKWNPVTDMEFGLKLYETMLDVTNQIVPQHKKNDDTIGGNNNSVFLSEIEDQDNGKDACTMIKNSVMFDVIYHKLHYTLSEWTPEANKSGNPELVLNPLHSWLIPWLPHLDYKSMLIKLLPDIKRKIKNSINFASKRCKFDQSTLWFQWALNTIKKWQHIFDKKTLQSITSECVTLRLGRYLSNIMIDQSSESNEHHFKLVMTFYDEGILEETEFSSLIEGEVLYKLASTIYMGLSSKNMKVSQAANLYLSWKKRMKGLSLKLDLTICRIFYGCLLMIKAASANDGDSLEDLEPPSVQSMNYKTVQARRAKENRLNEEEEMMRGRFGKEHNMKYHKQFHTKEGVTFKEVIEDYASHHEILFLPKSGPNTLIDGKRIYTFGLSQIYIDSNVIFVSDKGTWKPVSLNELTAMS